eukprot:277358_1
MCQNEIISIKHYEIAMKLNPSVTNTLAYITYWLDKSKYVKVHSLYKTIKLSEVKRLPITTQAKYNLVKSMLLLVFYANHRALQYFERSMQLYSTLVVAGNPIHMNKAQEMYYRLGKYTKSLKILTSMHAHAQKKHDTSRSFNVYLMMASNYFQLEKYEQAKEYFLLLINGQDSSTYSIVEDLLMFCEANLNNWDSAKKLYIARKSEPQFNTDPTKLYFFLRYNAVHKRMLEDRNWKLLFGHPFDSEYNQSFFTWYRYHFFALTRQHVCDYKNAILIHYWSNYVCIHGITYFKLAECYLNLMLPILALKCLRKSFKISPEVPTISINFHRNKLRLESITKKLKCDVCKAKYNEIKLYPCAGCFKIYYCSKKCQKVGWSRKMHRNICDKKYVLFAEKLKGVKRNPMQVALKPSRGGNGAYGKCILLPNDDCNVTPVIPL